MTIITVVGARPQFIKAAVISRVLRYDHEEIIIHTGQHFDYNMSEIFFQELDIPKPDFNLGVAGKGHGRMTGEMLAGLEDILLSKKPDLLIVYGDTNSTLAGALASVKLHIPVCHVEAGVRIGSIRNPEEVNRICTDHVSSLHMCCTMTAVESLKQEGIVNNVNFVGDPMYDAFLYYGKHLSDEFKLEKLKDLEGIFIEIPNRYYYMTCHRPENNGSDHPLTEMMMAMESLDVPTIYPVHPRNRERVVNISAQYGFKNIILTEPVGYLTSLALIKGAKKVVTDSGGLQREAFFAGVQCVTVFDYVTWPETMVGRQNQLARPDRIDILDKLSLPMIRDEKYQPFGDGHSGQRIVSLITNYLRQR